MDQREYNGLMATGVQRQRLPDEQHGYGAIFLAGVVSIGCATVLEVLRPAMIVTAPIVLLGVASGVYALGKLANELFRFFGVGPWRQQVIPPYVPPKNKTRYEFIPTNKPSTEIVKALTVDMIETGEHVAQDVRGNEVDMYDLALFVAVGAARELGGGGLGYGQKKWRDHGPDMPSTGERLKPSTHTLLVAEMDRALTSGGYFTPAIGTKQAELHAPADVALRALGIWQFAPDEYRM